MKQFLVCVMTFCTLSIMNNDLMASSINHVMRNIYFALKLVHNCSFGTWMPGRYNYCSWPLFRVNGNTDRVGTLKNGVFHIHACKIRYILLCYFLIGLHGTTFSKFHVSSFKLLRCCVQSRVKV